MRYRGILQYAFKGRPHRGTQQRTDESQDLVSSLLDSGWKKPTKEISSFVIETEDMGEIWRGIELVAKQSACFDGLKFLTFGVVGGENENAFSHGVEYSAKEQHKYALHPILRKDFPCPGGKRPEPGLCEKHIKAVDAVANRMERITRELEKAEVQYALVGGQAVAMWIATKDPAAVRTTKNVDLLVNRADLPRVKKAALDAGMDPYEDKGAVTLLDRPNRDPRHAVGLIWAGEKVRPEDDIAAPSIEERQPLGPGGKQVISLEGLVRMKLTADRDMNRVHLRDMIDIELINRDMLGRIPKKRLSRRLETLLDDAGR